MEKEKTVADLLSLRSGLSLISTYTDEIRNAEQNKSHVNKKIEHTKKEKAETGKKLELFHCKYEDMEERCENAKRDYEERKHQFESFDEDSFLTEEQDDERIKQRVNSSAPKRAFFCFDPNWVDFPVVIFPGFYDDFGSKALKWLKAAASIYITGIIFLFLFGTSQFITTSVYVIWGATAFPAALTVILPIVWGLLFLVKLIINFIFGPPIELIRVCIYNTIQFPKEKRRFKERYNDLMAFEKKAAFGRMQHAKNILKDKMDSAEAYWKQLEDALDKFKTLNPEFHTAFYFDEKIEKEKCILQKIENNIKKLAKKSEHLTKALQNTYGVTLSQSDWVHLDVILHYLLTGRADTLKEALQQLDRQHQTDQIVGAIKSAEQAIGNHIQTAISELGQALTISFEKIDRRLQTISIDIMEAGDAINQKIDSQNRMIDSQINLQEMNNALLKKANCTSETLLNDLRYNQRYWIK